MAIVICAIAAYGSGQTADAAVGRIDGQSIVSSSGEATYSIKIEVPPGINDLTPELALVYGHRQEEGLAGVGWSVAGLSKIRRCAKTMAQTGIGPKAVELSTSDHFCRDGVQLRRVSGTNGEDQSTYRTEIDTITRYTAHGTAGNGPASFEAESRSGLTYQFGTTEDSRIQSLASGYTDTVITWALSQVYDRDGNEIEFEYSEDGAPGGGHRISKISYRINDSELIPSAYEVQFHYEPHPPGDVDTGYAAGGKIEDKKRLDRIDVRYVYASVNSLVRRYEVTYESALSSTGRSRVEKIEECAGSPLQCLPATTFSYQDGTSGYGSEISSGSVLASSANAVPLDLNGDGRTDVAFPSGGTWRYRIANPGGGFGAVQNSGIADTNQESAFPMDYDQNGMVDIMVPLAGNTWWAIPGSATGLQSPVDTGAPVTSTPGNALALDMDGDGREDLVYGENIGEGIYQPEIYVRYRQPGAGFSSTPTFLWGPGYSTQVIGPLTTGAYRQSRANSFDINGDGYKDLVILASVRQYAVGYYTEVIPGGGVEPFIAGAAEYSEGAPVDINGDGYTDLIYVNNQDELTIHTSSGKSVLQGVNGPQTTGLNFGLALARDWNTDGFEDVLVPSTSTGTWHYLLSNGDTLLAPVDSGVSAANPRSTFPIDGNGDGLDDIAYVKDSGTYAYVPHAGVKPDLLKTVTDGNGNSTTFNYESISVGSYTRYSDATFPQQDYAGPIYVVSNVDASSPDGSGTYTRTFTYSGAQRNLEGRGLAGFDKKVTVDSRTGIEVVEYFRRDFPFRGRLYRRELNQPGGTPIQTVDYSWAMKTGNLYLYRQYHFPYIESSIEKNYEYGGTYDGAQINEITTDYVYDSFGTQTSVTKVTKEMAGANGLQPGATYTEQTVHSNISNNTTTWCLGKPGRTDWTNSHSGSYGAQITRTVTRVWDTSSSCRLDQETVEPSSADYKVTRSIDYDRFGNVDSQTVIGINMLARTTSVYWGPFGQFPETVTNPLGQSSTRAWDYVTGLQDSETDPNGITVSWQYDEFGRRTRETAPDGTYTSYILADCNAANNYCGTSYSLVKTKVRASQRRTNGTEIRYDDTFLDKADRTVQVEEQTMSGSISRVRTVYDALGRVEKRSALSFSLNPQYYTEMEYDLLNRPTQISRPIDATNPTLQFTTVDYEGLTVVTTDAEGKKSTKVMDALDRVYRSIDHDGYYQQTDYDAFGSIRRVQDPQDNLFRATYGYGAKAFRETSYDMDLGSWTYTPNAVGEVEAYSDAKGQNFSATFDKLSRPLTRTEPGESTTWTWGTSAAANNIGRLQSVATGAHQIEYFYDSAGRISQRKTTADAVYLTDYGYDAVSGLLKSLTYPESTSGYRLKLEYFYQNGILNKVADFDPPNTVGWIANAVDARGNVIDSTLGNGIEVILGFDAVTGRPDYFQAGPGGGSWTQDLTFDWNKVGSLTERADLNRGLTEEFFYDNLHRLDYSELNNVQNLDIGYDSLGRGNITYKSDAGPGTWTYHDTKEHAVTAAGGNTYSYDANGNQISRNGDAVEWTSYNYPSRIENGAESHEFSYDGDRQRWKQVYNGPSGQDVTIFVGQLLEKRTAGGVTEYRHYIRAGNTPVALYTRDTIGQVKLRYLLQDQLGSMSEITKSDSNPYVSESFSAFGQRRDAADWSGPPSPGDKALIADATQRGFTFHTNLEESNLVHMNGRVADAVTGRFLSPDPFIPDVGSTQSFNRYSYVRNNPLSATDPSGFFEFACFDNVTCTFSVIGSALSFLGDLFGGDSAPPPPKGCFVAAGPCYGPSAASKIQKIFRDAIGLPHERFEDRYGGIVLNIQDSAIDGGISGARRALGEQVVGDSNNPAELRILYREQYLEQLYERLTEEGRRIVNEHRGTSPRDRRLIYGDVGPIADIHVDKVDQFVHRLEIGKGLKVAREFAEIGVTVKSGVQESDLRRPSC